ncbi:MAG: hypothetical protein ABIH21_05185 [Patescibacteria group bacterium]
MSKKRPEQFTPQDEVSKWKSRFDKIPSYLLLDLLRKKQVILEAGSHISGPQRQNMIKATRDEITALRQVLGERGDLRRTSFPQEQETA